MKNPEPKQILGRLLLVILLAIETTRQQALDTSYSYYTGSATAMDINHASSFVVFAN
jgi:hypothetical protein